MEEEHAGGHEPNQEVAIGLRVTRDKDTLTGFGKPSTCVWLSSTGDLDSDRPEPVAQAQQCQDRYGHERPFVQGVKRLDRAACPPTPLTFGGQNCPRR